MQKSYEKKLIQWPAENDTEMKWKSLVLGCFRQVLGGEFQPDYETVSGHFSHGCISRVFFFSIFDVLICPFFPWQWQ